MTAKRSSAATAAKSGASAATSSARLVARRGNRAPPSSSRGGLPSASSRPLATSRIGSGGRDGKSSASRSPSRVDGQRAASRSGRSRSSRPGASLLEHDERRGQRRVAAQIDLDRRGEPAQPVAVAFAARRTRSPTGCSRPRSPASASAGSQASSGHTAAGLPVNGPSVEGIDLIERDAHGFQHCVRRAPQRVGVVERAVAAAEAGRACDRAAHIVARAVDRRLDRQALRQAGGDRRGQRAAGAVRVPAVDPRALARRADAAGGRQHVVDRVAREVPALEQHRAAAELQQRPRPRRCMPSTAVDASRPARISASGRLGVSTVARGISSASARRSPPARSAARRLSRP